MALRPALDLLDTGWVLVNWATGGYDEQATSTPYNI
jgi:hypothetical protein